MNDILKSLTKKQKFNLLRIVIAAVLAIVIVLLPFKGLIKIGLFLIPYVIIGYDVIRKAALNIAHGKVFDENFLMSVATIGALILGKGLEAVAVMIFYQIGELFESIALEKSRKNISDLMDIAPEFANVELEDGNLEQVDPSEIEVGSIIIVKPGEKIPIDGIIERGRSVVDTSALTGESLPVDVEVGSEVISGCINKTGLLRVRTTKVFEDSTVSRILELVEDASFRKASTENFITRFAKIYTPVVCIAALVIAVMPPAIRFAMDLAPMWTDWIIRGLTFLVISCPCALVISIPLGFFGGIGGASSKGILIKGSNYLEMLAKADNVVMDKTGTLTKGEFEVTDVIPTEISWMELMEYAAYGEYYSNHPLSKCIINAYPGEINPERISGFEEIPGRGIIADLDGKELLTGNLKLMDENNIDASGIQGLHTGPMMPDVSEGSPIASMLKITDYFETAGSKIHVAYDGQYRGFLVVEDILKDNSAETVAALKERGILTTVLTGDSEAAAVKISDAVGADRVEYDLLPADKVRIVEIIMEETAEKGTTVFVGDGVNDAPVIMRADVGIAMGAMGSDAAIEAADIVLMDDDPAKLNTAINIAQKTMSIVRQNIVFTLAVKFACLILAALGIVGMWAAIFADVGVMIIAVLNSMRTMRIGDDRPAATAPKLPKLKTGRRAGGGDDRDADAEDAEV